MNFASFSASSSTISFCSCLVSAVSPPFQPFYGGNIRALLFELAYDDVADDVEDNIRAAIERFEPRAIVRRVDAKADPDINSIRVTIEFQIINSEELVTFSTTLSRLR